MSNIYKYFSKDREYLDYSDEMLLELFIAESYGGDCSSNNGYYIGKKYLNLSVSMWKEDIKLGFLFINELYKDEELENWFLDKVFKTRNI